MWTYRVDESEHALTCVYIIMDPSGRDAAGYWCCRATARFLVENYNRQGL